MSCRGGRRFMGGGHCSFRSRCTAAVRPGEVIPCVHNYTTDAGSLDWKAVDGRKRTSSHVFSPRIQDFAHVRVHIWKEETGR